MRSSVSVYIVLLCGVCFAAAAADAAAGDRLTLSPTPGAYGGAWRFHNGGEFPGAAGVLEEQPGGTLRLAFDFSGGGRYVAAYRTFDPPVSLEEISFRAKKPRAAALTVRVTGADGQTFQKSVHFGASEWQAFAFDFENWTGNWGGDNDGVLAQPIREMGLLLEASGLDAPAGEVLFADIAGLPASGENVSYLKGGYSGQYTVTDFGNSAGFSSGGPASLENGVWAIDFARGNSATLGHSISLFGKPQELTLTARSSAPGVTLSMRIGSHFQTFSRAIGVLDGTEQTFTFSVPPEGWQFGGGENDGIARLPLRITALEANRGDAPAAPCAITLGTLRCTTRLPRSRAVTILAKLAPAAPGRMQVRCQGWNVLETPVEGTLTCGLYDWENTLLVSESRPAVLGADGAPGMFCFDLPAPAALNFVEARVSYATPGQHPAESEATYARPLEGEGSTERVPESPWGMGVFLYRYGGDEGGLKRMDQAAALAQQAGVKWSREEFSWAGIETAPGDYDFSYYDNVVNTAMRHGISVYGLLAYWGRFTEPYTEKGIEDFCAWTRATVRHFKDRVKHWEIYNEPNIFFWSGPRELYPVLLAKCYVAVKEEDPEALVLGCSTAGIDNEFIKKTLEAKAPFDILTVHPYRGQLNDGGFIGELRETSGIANNRPIWITEMGWSTCIGNTSERTQAELIARCYLDAAASGVCHNIGWYDFKDDGRDPFYFEDNFGVLRNDFTAKPAFRALASVCRSLSGGAVMPREEFGAGILAVTRGNALALWSDGANRTLQCKVNSGTPTAINLMGDPVPLRIEDNTLTLELRAGIPIFLFDANLTPLETAQEAPAEVVHF